MPQFRGLAIFAIMTALGCGQLFAGQADEEKAREAGLPWKLGQLHAAYEGDAKTAIVDVNDNFLLESTKTGAQTVLRIGVTDGMRSKYLSCADTKDIKAGEPRTTWLEISYSPLDNAGYRDYSITRTADFYGNIIVDRFRSNGNSEYAPLGGGTVAELNDGTISYSQTSGPIGFSGKTTELKVTAKIGAQFGDIDTTVQLNPRSWRITTILGVNGTPVAFNVNGSSIQPYLADIKLPNGKPPVIVTAPISADSTSSLVSRVAYTKNTPLEQSKKTPTLKEIRGVTHQMLAAPIPCNGQPCISTMQCSSTIGSTCRCHQSGAMVPGLCLI